MALKQPNSATVWSESKDSGVARAITPVSLAADAYGGYSVTRSGSIDARMLADGFAGFSVHAGGDNPSALAELRMIDASGSSGVVVYR